MTAIDDAIKKAVIDTVRCVHDRKYDGIIISGRSCVIAQSWFDAAWEKLYSDEDIPEFFVIPKEYNDLLYSYNFEEELKRRHSIPPTEQIISSFETELAKLWSARERRLCFLDDFADSGIKYEAFKKAFGAMGFRQVEYAFFCTVSGDYLGADTSVGRVSPCLSYIILDLAKRLGGESVGNCGSEQTEKTIQDAYEEVWRFAGIIKAS